MMKKEPKIIIIGLSLLILSFIGFTAWQNLGEEKYPVKELLIKYPLISDLKKALNSGELNYDRLPDDAKVALEKYDSFQETNTEPEIIKELSP